MKIKNTKLFGACLVSARITEEARGKESSVPEIERQHSDTVNRFAVARALHLDWSEADIPGWRQVCITHHQTPCIHDNIHLPL